MPPLLAAPGVVLGATFAYLGFSMTATCGGLSLFFYGVAILCFSTSGAVVGGARILTLLVPCAIVVMAGGLFFAGHSGCL